MEYILLMASHWGGNIASSLTLCFITIRHFLPSLSDNINLHIDILTDGCLAVVLTLEAGWGHHIIKPFSDKSLGKFASSGQSDSALPSLQMSGAARSLSVQFSGAATFKYPRRTQENSANFWPRRAFPCKLV